MIETVILLLSLGLIIAAIVMAPLFTRYRRHHLKQQPFPLEWQNIIENALPFYDDALSANDRSQLQGHIQVFLAEKQFIGCNELNVTIEMKLVIAAVSCLLLMNRQTRYFSQLKSILVYPSHYTTQQTRWVSPYVVEETKVARLGESWTRGQVVLSWAQIIWDMNHWHDGHNIILHEFAHQLDAEDHTAAGVPVLPSQAAYDQWAQVMKMAYEQLCETVQQGRQSVIDSYGATNPAEFFSVVTETFFERPQLLRHHYSDVYTLLQYYYQLDPDGWFSE